MDAENLPTPDKKDPDMDAKIGAILLAAGQSRRSGNINKLLAPIDGQVMVRSAARAMIAGPFAGVTVVTGHQAARVQEALSGLAVRFIHNKDYEQGMASSIRCGVGALDGTFDGVVIGLGDMPHVQTATLNSLVDAFSPSSGHDICLPHYQNKPGNPVLFGRRHFPQLKRLEGDKGGKSIARKNPGCVIAVAVDDPGIHMDHDVI